MAPGENESDTPGLGESMLLQMARLHSFLWPSNIPSHICTTSSLFNHLSVGTEVDPTSWLL